MRVIGTTFILQILWIIKELDIKWLHLQKRKSMLQKYYNKHFEDECRIERLIKAGLSSLARKIGNPEKFGSLVTLNQVGMVSEEDPEESPEAHGILRTETNDTPPRSRRFVCLHTHQHRKNKTWVDRKSEHVYGKYKHRWEELTQQASLEGNPPPKEIDVWTEVAGIRKGHIYGLGSESSLFASRRNYRGSSSSSTEWVQRHEFEEMKFERDELRDMVKQLMESLNFQPKPYTRDQVHEDDVVDDNETIVDNNDDNSDGNFDDNDDMSDDDDGMSNDNDDMSDDDNEESF
ncbi:hypothetical protein P8452_46171 [Trifolium repens]|nr:hypothetical protein P8452_46171 [Trifolium repens]